METTGLILARALGYVTLMLSAGLPIYWLAAGAGDPSHRQRIALALVAGAAAAASFWWSLESVAAMAGAALSALDRETFTVVLKATPLGTVLALRLGALAAAAAAVLFAPDRLRLPLAAVGGAIALGSMAWTGHAGATEGDFGIVHRVADGIHLLAAATWLGALTTFVVRAFDANAIDRARELAAFARTGSIILALLVLTGVANTLFIAGWPLPLESRWTLLLAIKLALFGGMLGLAALNRWRITPALELGEIEALPRLQRSLLLETTLGVAIVAVVALLGVLDPAT